MIQGWLWLVVLTSARNLKPFADNSGADGDNPVNGGVTISCTATQSGTLVWDGQSVMALLRTVTPTGRRDMLWCWVDA